MKYRSYKRIYFDNPLKGLVSITKVHGYPVKTKSSPIAIHNLSHGGLSFSSNLDFPLKDMELLFKIHLLGKSINLKGTISWQRQDANGLYYYGVQLGTLNVQFYQTLDQLSPRLKSLA